ncbi:MAG: Mov34/MPN/PAD-1 family protein [Candidatus Poribacteria bacterium]|nr:Mov34/MPN/PAD-1 family protein [Candidatus Poribacteria bacterium]
MKIHLPIDIQKRLIPALEKAGSYEIGGVLMGEHIDKAEFRIVDLTIQAQFGSIAFFTRLVADIVKPLKGFFKRTGYNYRKFNYLGEWHSHPSFPPVPSQKDIQSMQEIVTDSDTGANFVILLIVKIKKTQEIEATATVFFQDGQFFECELIKEKLI